uniref:Uncharacterized protein n=1 Tax=Anguilla anguilla TaxID=7936 RepID=A0A0E9P8E7_ANGAN
MPDGVLKP